MAEIVQGGQTFEIKGDEPTPQEQIAIDTFLKARNFEDEMTGIQDIDEGRVFITPEEILSEAEKGKYNKDTESFLSSPTFKRLVAEVGLSIAGGVAGFAAAPFTGGSSLIGTAAAATRIARLVRPLINISSRQVAKMGSGTVGAALGGGSGAAIAQTFDPKEDIVKEVARGAAQGAFGEVLGFGMAGALGKAYNKVAGQKIQMIKGGRSAAQVIARQKAYYNLLEQSAGGKPVTDELVAKVQADLGKKMSEEQLAILKDPKKAKETAELLKRERGEDFFERVERGSLTPALVTENNIIDTLESVIGASFFGGGRFISAQQGSRLGLLGGMDEFVNTVVSGVDKSVIDQAKLETLIVDAIADGNKTYKKILDDGYKDLRPRVAALTEQTLENGRVIPKPGYGIDLSWDGVRKNYVYNSTTKLTEDSRSLKGIIESERKRLDGYAQKSATASARQLLSELETLPNTATFNQVADEYRALSQSLRASAKDPMFQETGRKIQKLLKAELDRAPLPKDLRAKNVMLGNLNKMGPEMFNNGILARIATRDVGQKKILDQILIKGKNDVADDFFKKLDMTDNGIVATEKGAGTRLIKKEDADKIKDGIRGQFIKKFIADSTEPRDQYLYLRANKARDFVERDYKEFIEEGGLLTDSQVGQLKEFVKTLKFADGAITAPGVKSGRGTIFIQLKEAGAITQMGTVFLSGQGYIDPGTATAFVLAPAALSRLFTNPRLMKFLIDGTKGAKSRNFNQFSRFMGQFGSALVAEGLITEENNSMVQTNIKTNQENIEKLIRGEIPDGDFFPEEDINPAKADAIPFDLNEGRIQSTTAQRPNPVDIPLPNVEPSNIPLGGAQQSNLQLAQALNLFNKGGIVSAKKVNT
tara:strand:- start:199 stop:2820 length:2622 start_codon:yes stop_codon:yes gene_type:complete